MIDRAVLHPLASRSRPGERRVRAGWKLTPEALLLTYAGRLPFRIPPPAGPARADNLWTTTCFELFLRGARGAYVEWNLSPSGQWAAYGFDARRSGMRDLDTPPPAIAWQADGDAAVLTATVPLAGILAHVGQPPWQANVAAVIETVEGATTYHALAHPDGPPDFHDPACFVATIG